MKYILESNQIITDFEISYRTIFGNKIESMKSISTCIKELANVKKGTILVISNTAEKLIDNYADLCIKIEPTILSSANIKKLSSLCPALQDSHLPDARPFSKDYQFGPGWQWEVDTEDDVWVLPMPDAYAVVHGVTGEVLNWSFTYPTKENYNVRYENMMPEKMDHTAAIERAIQIAEEKSDDEKEWARDILYANAYYGYKEDWRISQSEAGENSIYPVPLWMVDLSYYVPGEDQARFVAGFMLDEDGNVLAERDPETRVFK